MFKVYVAEVCVFKWAKVALLRGAKRRVRDSIGERSERRLSGRDKEKAHSGEAMSFEG